MTDLVRPRNLKVSILYGKGLGIKFVRFLFEIVSVSGMVFEIETH